jgi:hypothetical protein
MGRLPAQAAASLVAGLKRIAPAACIGKGAVKVSAGIGREIPVIGICGKIGGISVPAAGNSFIFLEAGIGHKVLAPALLYAETEEAEEKYISGHCSSITLIENFKSFQ